MTLVLSLLTADLWAQRVIVEGSNMNVGASNTLDDNGGQGRPTGNAVGLQNILFSDHSLAVGFNDTIDTNSAYSVTLGANNYIMGETAMGIGRSVKVIGNDNIGIGHHIRVNGRRGGMVIGSGIEGTGDAYLVNDSSNCLMVGFNSTKPTLFVGASPNDHSQSILNRTGRVAIGDVMPQAKLHIRSDSGENAGIILEPDNPSTDSVFIRLMDSHHGIYVGRQGQMDITAGNKPLGIASANLKVDGNLMELKKMQPTGVAGPHGFTLSTDGTPSIGFNAYPSNGHYLRGTGESSYVMEFSSASLKLRTAQDSEPRGGIISNWTDAVTVKTDGAITLNGKVGVNTENTTDDYALAVDGGVITTKVHIQEVGDWQDRVFSEDYPLMSLDEVGAYVAENKHLPGIPSEAEVKANGYDVAEMQAALLGKIEELTLHMLRQQREIDSLRTLVTVSFGYDACGNRTSRTLEFSRMEAPDSSSDGTPLGNAQRWQASITDSFAGGEAMLFPTPTEGGFYLSLGGESLSNGIRATLCTPDGKVLEERTVTGATEEFDLTGRPAGIYLLRLTSKGEAKVWKVIKRN